MHVSCIKLIKSCTNIVHIIYNIISIGVICAGKKPLFLPQVNFNKESLKTNFHWLKFYYFNRNICSNIQKNPDTLRSSVKAVKS